MICDDVIISGNEIVKITYAPQKEIKKLHIPLEELEEQIRQMVYYGANPVYGFNKLYDQKLEHSYIPPFVDTFYMFVYEKLHVPTQKEFWEYYLERNKQFLSTTGEKIKIDFLASHFSCDRKAYLARAIRTYPSLLRDFHFLMMLQNDDFFCDKYYYSLSNDFNKVDVTINHNGTHKIGLDVNTPRCNDFRNAKQKRHEYSDVKYFSINLDEGKRLGKATSDKDKFILYPMSVIDELKDYVNGNN